MSTSTPTTISYCRRYVSIAAIISHFYIISKCRGKRILPILLVTNDQRFAHNVQAANPNVNILTLEQVADMKAIFQPAIPVVEMVNKLI